MWDLVRGLLDGALTVACGAGAVRVTRLQRAGRAPQEAADFLRDVHWSFDVQKPFLIRYHHLESGCEVEE